MASSKMYNVSWNNYTPVLHNSFRQYLQDSKFVDVTLSCEGQNIKCHRLILAACSSYFDSIFKDNSTPNLVICLTDMKFWVLRALVIFMYNGKIRISKQKLPHLWRAAEKLKVRGLAPIKGLIDDGEMDRQEDLEDESEDLLELQGIKRKTPTPPPPKLVKIQKVEGQSNDRGGIMRRRQLPISVVKKIVRKPQDQEMSKSVSGTEEEEDNTMNQEEETGADSGIKGCEDEPGDIKGNHEMNGVDEDDSSDSEAYKVAKQKDAEIWQRRQAKQNGGEQASSSKKSYDNIISILPPRRGVPLPPKTTNGPPVDAEDRAQRMMKASYLAFMGVTVRQAAAHFEIPRTTLCAYMKRHGLAAKRRSLLPGNPRGGGGANNSMVSIQQMGPIRLNSNAPETNGQEGGGGHAFRYEDYSFVDIIMDEMGQEGSYDAEGQAEEEGEEDDS